ncbi:MAG: transposon-encoded TnpW family protein [Oscillospiraceae bacterium]|nr:transposon-encoded TnpW family protein [Oscillospiraceae bacterium]
MQKTTTAVKEPPPESGVFMKRIGSTNYRVNVHFSKTSRETANDKIIRMIKNETTGKAAGE